MAPVADLDHAVGHPHVVHGDGDGRVGNGFLSNYKVTVDGPGLKLVLTPVKRDKDQAKVVE